MAKEKVATPTPPIPKTVVETEADEVKSLETLQDQAKFNTRCLTNDVRLASERDLELQSLETHLAAMDENPESEEELLEQQRIQERIGVLRKEAVDLQQRILQRRARSGSLIRRRASLQREHDEKEQRRIEQERDETTKKLKLGDLVSRHTGLLSELVRLAEDAQQAQFKARSPEQRDLARRLMALQRACFAAHESLKRVPELVIGEGE